MIQQAFAAELSIGAPRRHQNLTMVPLFRGDREKAEYLTLDEALATGQFHIREVSKTGRVPELRAVNELDRPVLLLDGEELIGAKQNRVLNLTILVPALSALIIPVSCVEAGRWRHTTNSFGAADRAQFARGRARKLVQVSDALASVGSPVAEQGDVWNEIACKSSRMAVHSTTQAMAALFEHAQSDVNDVVDTLAAQSEQVGAVFFFGDQIAGIDVFGHSETYAKLAPKILRSYALDAVESPVNGSALSDQALTATSTTFLADLGRSLSRPSPALGLGEDIRLSGPRLAGAMLAVDGAAIHLVAFPEQTFADRAP